MDGTVKLAGREGGWLSGFHCHGTQEPQPRCIVFGKENVQTSCRRCWATAFEIQRISGSCNSVIACRNAGAVRGLRRSGNGRSERIRTTATVNKRETRCNGGQRGPGSKTPIKPG